MLQEVAPPGLGPASLTVFDRTVERTVFDAKTLGIGAFQSIQNNLNGVWTDMNRFSPQKPSQVDTRPMMSSPVAPSTKNPFEAYVEWVVKPVLEPIQTLTQTAIDNVADPVGTLSKTGENIRQTAWGIVLGIGAILNGGAPATQ